jgi:hypothetical protein
MRSGSRADLKNETGQLIERVDRLQAQKNQRRDHQIETEMHEGLATKCFLPRARIAQGREPNSVRIGKTNRPTNHSPAIGTESFRRRGSDAFVVNLFNRRSLVRRQFPVCLHAVEDLDSPQHHDDGRY